MNFDSSFHSLEFLRPYWLLGIVVVIFYAFIHYQRHKSKHTEVIAAHLSEHLVTSPETNKSNRWLLNTLAIITCIALAGPTFRSLDIPVFETQKAQVIAFDLSRSMYATDIQPNRLAQAKFKAIDLLKSWKEGDKALIGYAGDAFTIAPLTTDSNAIISHIPHLSPDIMPVLGSRPDLALQKSIQLLENAGYQQGHIVFITDGFDPASEQKMKAMLTGTKWMVSVLAMATPQGAPIKLNDGRLLKNDQGHIVVPQLIDETLYPITRINHGLYLTFDAGGQDVKLLSEHYQQHNKRKENRNQQQQDNRQAVDDGYWLAFLLLPLFLLLFRKGVFYLLIFTLILPLSSTKVEASIWKNKEQNAYQSFQDGDYQTASESFQDKNWQAAAYFKDGQYKQAEAIYQDQKAQDANNAETLYNLANSQAMQEKYEQALENVNQALTIKPDFPAAQQTQKALQELLKEQEQQNQEKQEQSSQDKNTEQNQQDKQQSSEQESQDKQDQQDSQQQSSEQESSEQQSQQSQEQSSQQQDNSSAADQAEQDQQQSEEQQDAQQKSSHPQNKEQTEQEKDKQQAQQQAEQQASQEQDEQAVQAAQSAELADDETNPEYEALPNWLKNMPDDPSLLLRNKMHLEYRKRAADKPVIQKQNGETW